MYLTIIGIFLILLGLWINWRGTGNDSMTNYLMGENLKLRAQIEKLKNNQQ